MNIFLHNLPALREEGCRKTIWAGGAIFRDGGDNRNQLLLGDGSDQAGIISSKIGYGMAWRREEGVESWSAWKREEKKDIAAVLIAVCSINSSPDSVLIEEIKDFLARAEAEAWKKLVFLSPS